MVKLCPKCGVEKLATEFYHNRSRADGLTPCCKVCFAAYASEYRKRRRRQDSQYRSRLSATNKAWCAAHPEASREIKKRHKLKKYGLSPEAYADLLEKQNGLCAICSEPPSDAADLCIDHDHFTGHVRGLLCVPCNLLLGFVLDSPLRLRQAADYLDVASQGVVGTPPA